MSEQHPSFETLLDLTLDELSEPRAAEVREHLMDCSECLRKTRELLEEPDEPPEQLEPVSSGERDRAWRDLRETLEAEGLTPPPAGRERGLLPFRLPRLPSRLPAGTGSLIAAAAAILAFGLGYLVRPDQPALPANMLAAETLIEGDGTIVRGSVGSPTRVDCPTPEYALVWKLSLADPPPQGETARVKIQLPDGSVEGPLEIRVNAAGQLLLNRRPHSTPPGLYVIEIWGGEAAPETFRLSVQCGS